MSNFHKQKEKFLRAVRATAGTAGFSEELIEKDYYCSLILKEIFQIKDCPLVFKGGTLLNKVHFGFYRLSEDLDFSISAEESLSRKKRSALAQSAKKSIISAFKNLSLVISKSFEGRNENRLYSTEVEYNSLVSENKNTIKIEFGVEKIWERESLKAKTLLVDPIAQKPIIPDFLITGLSLKEAYSEKIRAALSREKPAVRDIFDIHYALKKHLIGTKGLVKIHEINPMVKYKLKVLNRKIDLSSHRKKELLSQLQTDLKPVLRQKDFEDFNFEQAWGWLKKFEQSISKSL